MRVLLYCYGSHHSMLWQKDNPRERVPRVQPCVPHSMSGQRAIHRWSRASGARDMRGAGGLWGEKGSPKPYCGLLEISYQWRYWRHRAYRGAYEIESYSSILYRLYNRHCIDFLWNARKNPPEYSGGLIIGWMMGFRVLLTDLWCYLGQLDFLRLPSWFSVGTLGVCHHSWVHQECLRASRVLWWGVLYLVDS